MGQIAEDIITGRVCSICGQFFTTDDDDIYEHKYPVVCWDDWDDLSEMERKQYQRAEVKTL